MLSALLLEMHLPGQERGNPAHICAMLPKQNTDVWLWIGVFPVIASSSTLSSRC